MKAGGVWGHERTDGEWQAGVIRGDMDTRQTIAHCECHSQEFE